MYCTCLFLFCALKSQLSTILGFQPTSGAYSHTLAYLAKRPEVMSMFMPSSLF